MNHYTFLDESLHKHYIFLDEWQKIRTQIYNVKFMPPEQAFAKIEMINYQLEYRPEQSDNFF